MTNLKITDARVRNAANKVEELATKIETLVTPDVADIIIDRLYAITRPLRQQTGVCREAFNRIKAMLDTTTPEKFIMANIQ